MANAIDTGPFLLTAILCREAITGPDGGVTGLNGATSGYHVKGDGPEAPDEMPPVRAELKAVLILAAGQGRGRHFTVSLQPEAPSEAMLNRGELPIQFADNEQATATIVVDYGIDLVETGLHWVDVTLTLAGDKAGRLLTRMPLNVTYSPK